VSLNRLVKVSFQSCCQCACGDRLGVLQFITIMRHAPPLDQRIVDDYFNLDAKRATKSVAWLYGMVATFGITPDQFRDKQWTWHEDCILFDDKKRSIRPLHPQWVALFQLKEKQPRNIQSCLGPLCSSLYRAMAYQEVALNVTDLILAHRLRKSFYHKPKQQPQQHTRAFAAVS
jgi:hypothetical protein